MGPGPSTKPAVLDTGMGGPGPSTKPAIMDTGMGSPSDHTKPLLEDTGMGGDYNPSTKPAIMDTGMGGGGAPSGPYYKNKSGGIISVLEDLLEKAMEQLETAQKAEQTKLNSFALLKQSLMSELTNYQEDLAATKKSLSSHQESKATAKGDLSVTTVDYKEDTATLQTLHHDCMEGADEFQITTKSREEELKAIAKAKEILGKALPAAKQQYGLDQVSFLQKASLSNGADLAKFEAVRFIRDLARKENSVELAQLASRMSSAIRFGESSGADPFAKVKSLITDMIATLEKDAKNDASQKAYCDKELSETKAKKLEKEHEVDKLPTKIDSMAAKAAKLNE